MDDRPDEIVSELIDLTGVDLDELRTVDKAVLAASLERIIDEVEHPEGAVAGFQSSL